MGLLLVFFVVSILIGVIAWFCTAGTQQKNFWKMAAENAIGGFAIGIIIFGIVTAVIQGASYYSYIGLFEAQSSIEPRLAAIRAYSQYGVKDFGPIQGNEITDLKYQNYQQKIGELIKDLRYIVEKFNGELLTKREMKKSWFFNWVIVAPAEDMVPVNMKEILRE